MHLALAALLWLHPMLSNGKIEATGDPSLGLRAQTTLFGQRFMAASGTGYQSLRAQVVLPPTPGYPPSMLEIEHTLRTTEHHFYRITGPLSNRVPLFLTLEVESSRHPAWDYRSKDGHVPLAEVHESHVYLTWYGRSFIARAGAGSAEGAVVLEAVW